jgi:hypothetical protein
MRWGLALLLAIVPVASGLAQEPPAEPDPVVVWAVGDGADGSARAKRLARLIAADEPDRFLYLGDVYESGTAAELRSNFDRVYRGLREITEPTSGNHDWGRRHEGYFPYWESVRGRPLRPWYGLRIGGWEILSLNSEAAHGGGSRQLAWLRRRLRGAAGDCRLAFWHRPRLSAGVYGDDASFEPFWRALRGKARLVLSGHDHNMQRLRARHGIIQLVAGAGGRELYPLRSDARLRFGRDDRVGALRLELRDGRADGEFRGLRGRVLDRFSVRCVPSGDS